MSHPKKKNCRRDVSGLEFVTGFAPEESSSPVGGAVGPWGISNVNRAHSTRLGNLTIEC